MNGRVRWVAWCGYVILVGAGIARGGMWLDEMQVWCLGRDHHTVMDLLRTMRNEGHPPLWPLLVYGLSAVCHGPWAMAILHGLFAVATAWLILFRAPWPLGWRMVAVLGYFLLFEYAIVARNYGPAMFFLFAAITAHQAGRTWLSTVCLMALAMTHYWGIVVAAAWAVVMLTARDASWADRIRNSVVLATAALALYLAFPAEVLPYTPELHRVAVAQWPELLGGMLGQVFVPFPDLTQSRPWNTNWLFTHAPLLNSILGGIVLLLTVWCLAGSRRWLLFYLVAVIGVLAFPLFAPFRSVRYYGPVWMAFLAAIWMTPSIVARAKRAVLVALLLLQVPGAVAMTIVSQRTPRSMGERFVEWYRTGPYQDRPLMVHPYQAVPSISGYLGRPVFCPATNSEVSCCRWTYRPFRLDRDALLEAIQRSPFEQALLVADEGDLSAARNGGFRITPIADFQGAEVQSEQYHVYLVDRIEMK